MPSNWMDKFSVEDLFASRWISLAIRAISLIDPPEYLTKGKCASTSNKGNVYGESYVHSHTIPVKLLRTKTHIFRNHRPNLCSRHA
mmetsp:Transcript_15822/g.22152  ORF Transcript_15822/g.22152 Transcript_15822/m.22152 type:complete len:86 (-) Transcript_15822:119-376(-)